MHPIGVVRRSNPSPACTSGKLHGVVSYMYKCTLSAACLFNVDIFHLVNKMFIILVCYQTTMYLYTLQGSSVHMVESAKYIYVCTMCMCMYLYCFSFN